MTLSSSITLSLSLSVSFPQFYNSNDEGTVQALAASYTSLVCSPPIIIIIILTTATDLYVM